MGLCGCGNNSSILPIGPAGPTGPAGTFSGTLNRIAKFTPSGTQLGDSNWFDDGTNTGYGTTSMAHYLDIVKDQDDVTTVNIKNSSTGTSASSRFRLFNGATSLELRYFGSSFTTASANFQSGGLLSVSGAGGLSVVSSNASGDLRFYVGDATTIRARFLASNGYFGIGVSPSAPLHVYKTSGEVLRIATGAFGDPKMSFYDDVFELGYITTKRTAGNRMFFGTSSIEALSIGGNNIGIGYYDGNTRLYINNAGLATYSLIVDGGGSTGLCVTYSGDRVGVGTTAPEQKFDVLGIAQISKFQNATGGGTLQPSNYFQIQSAYWDGAASVSKSMKMRAVALSTTPTYKLAFYDDANTERVALHNNGVFAFEEFTVAGLPTASDYTAGFIMVTNETGGYVPAFSDGTNWRRVTDRAIVS